MSLDTEASYDYPRVIEPLQSEITVTETCQGVSQPVVFPRLAYTDLPPSLLSEVLGQHCFGELASDSRQVFFCYSTTGRIMLVCAHRHQQWHRFDIPAELAGLGVEYPSVRLVFKTERVRDAFLQLLRQVENGKVANASLSLCIADLAEPPRALQVVSQE